MLFKLFFLILNLIFISYAKNDIQNSLMSCHENFLNTQAFVQDTNKFFKDICMLSNLKQPRVTFYGGSNLLSGKYYDSAKFLAEKFVDNGFIVVSGGGPGIMEAVNCGGKNSKTKNKIKSIAIDAEGLKLNPCADIKIVHKYFFFRKLLLYSSDFAIFFPGGYGTLDELSEMLTLMKIKRRKKIPVILFGKEFWNPLMEWFNKSIELDLIPKEYRDLILIADNADEAFTLVMTQLNRLSK